MLLQVCVDYLQTVALTVRGEPQRVFAAKLVFQVCVKLHLTRIIIGIVEAPCVGRSGRALR
jgi:hypothetical protein